MIWNILKLMLTRWLSIKRWNNFPRIEDVSHLDNIWFVIHIALFLSYLEEKNWNKVDKEFIIKRIIFNSFKSLVLSDINSWTRDYIYKIDKNIFYEIEKKSYKYILSFDCIENIKNDLEKTIYNKEKTLELEIISASKKYAWFIECKINQKVFEDMYEVPLKEINLALENKRKKLYSLDTLLKNDNYIKYLTHIRRLIHSKRWNQQKRIFPISVMSHLVIITFLSYIIAMIENENGQKINMEDILFRAIYHDIPEAITWDIITPTKKAIEWFHEVLEKVEITMMDDYLFYYIWDDYKKMISKYMINRFDWEVWKLVKHADNLSALFEAKVEVNYSSASFSEIYKKIKKKLNSIDLKSVNYLLKHWIDSFDEKIDEINLSEI